jgi:hypothetical protein
MFVTFFQEVAEKGPMLGPFPILPQSIITTIGSVMAAIALWTVIKQKAAKAADLDGVGARVAKLDTALATLTGSVNTLTTMMQSFVEAQSSMAEHHGELARDTANCQSDAKDLRREIVGKLDKALEEQQRQGNRLARVEERLDIRAERE